MGPETLDRLFDAMFREQPEKVRKQIRRRYANKKTVAEAEQRLRMIALDGSAQRPPSTKRSRKSIRYRKHMPITKRMGNILPPSQSIAPGYAASGVHREFSAV